MRAIVVLFLLCVNLVWVRTIPSEDFVGWHEKVGIKNAQEIKQLEDRIVGGTVAPLHAHPYLAGLLIDVIGFSQPSACGGSLISSTRVLTAAHCWSDGRFQAYQITVVLGSAYLFHGGIRVLPYAIALHPQYNPKTFANDIAMLYLPNSIEFNQAIRPLILPYGSLLTMDYTGVWARAAGFGRFSDVITSSANSTIARNVFLQVITVQQCRNVFGNYVLESNICTNGYGGVGICQGDSGGPLTVTTTDGQDILIGVSSFVARDGCQLGYPSAFARVMSYMNWIRAHM
ncbi:collagenase-like [Galleria mellonella]|uniref:Collagenase-like n=1 Tax=Galleria mellonella TaxID=7137 RepID=A0A6J1X3E0_GALME|nr:collagenase-like [Galleria mellonella]